MPGTSITPAGTAMGALRLQQYGQRDTAPNPGGRSHPFTAQLRAKTQARNGGQFYHVEGYASVFNTGYEMFDMWGPYTEIIDPVAFDASLARSDLDVVFLLNHAGVTMARTTNDTLTVAKDDTGLGVDAWLNAKRDDVKLLVSAIDDNLVTEMSFAFWLTQGWWSDDFMTFKITGADIHRGDVSAVNYGASPTTSIAARAAELMSVIGELPAGAARAAMHRLAQRADVFSVPSLAAPATPLAVSPPVSREEFTAAWLHGAQRVSVAADGTHDPMTGTHDHMHPAMGSQGGDAQHSHSHDHAGDASHSHPHMNGAPAAEPAAPMSVQMLMHLHEMANAADSDQDTGSSLNV